MCCDRGPARCRAWRTIRRIRRPAGRGRATGSGESIRRRRHGDERPRGASESAPAVVTDGDDGAVLLLALERDGLEPRGGARVSRGDGEAARAGDGAEDAFVDFGAGGRPSAAATAPSQKHPTSFAAATRAQQTRRFMSSSKIPTRSRASECTSLRDDDGEEAARGGARHDRSEAGGVVLLGGVDEPAERVVVLVGDRLALRGGDGVASRGVDLTVVRRE